MLEKIDILGVHIDNVSFEEAKSLVLDMCAQGGYHRVYTPNSEIIMAANKDNDFKDIINSADLITPDGIGIVHASRIFGTPLKERVAGFDLLNGLLEGIAKNGLTLYLFGSKPGIAARAKAKIEERYPDIKIVGVSDGYFDSEREKEILSDINAKSPDVLAVCLGSPKQELWVYNNRERLNVKVTLCGGGSLDVLAGEVKRAPKFFISLGLEWLYRIASQPSRWGRAMELPRFVLAVFAHKLRKG